MDKIRCKDLWNKSDISFIDEFVATKENPWELLALIKQYTADLVAKGIEGYTLLKEGVLIGKNVKIAETASITGPAIIGNNVEIRPGAYIRGSVIVGDDSVLGNSSEFKNCILMRHCQCPHYNYIGDSILGNFAHTGAGSICSNLKSDGANIVIHGDEEHVTGVRKIGAFIGDHGDIGCGSVLNPGTVIGQNTQVYPLTMCRGVYKENCIVKGTREVVEKRQK